MVEKSADPVPSISEAEASGEVAAIYADIRTSLGVPVVNLIWRHLAIIPGALPWAWASLKPLYGTGIVAAEAAALRSELQVPSLAGLDAEALAAAGLGGDDLGRIIMILRSYERSNAMNIVALGALLAALEGASTGIKGGPPANPQPQPNEDPIVGEMPALLAPDAMAPELRNLVEEINRVGGRAEILATMYRHLAHWPAYLRLCQKLLAPLDATGGLESIILQAIVDGRQRSAAIAAALASPERAPGPEAEAQLRAALVQFIQGPLGKMIAIVALIRQAMPS